MRRSFVLFSCTVALAACTGPTSSEPPTGVFGHTTSVTGRAFAIDGGRMLVSGDRIVVAEPGHDRLVVFTEGEPVPSFQRAINFEPGEMPGRMAAGAGGVVVALPTAGAVVTVDPVSGDVLERREVCASPRGLAIDDRRGRLYVACADGRFSVWPSAGGPPIAEVRLPDDLRDVAIDARGTLVHVSRFRRAEVLSLDTDTLEITSTWRPAVHVEAATERRFEPRVAWRLLSRPEGGFGLLHQRHLVDSLPDTAAAVIDTPRPAAGYYGPPPGSAFGSPADCQTGVIQSALSEWDPAGDAELDEPPVQIAAPPLFQSPLAVDFVYSRPGAVARGAYVAGAFGVQLYVRESFRFTEADAEVTGCLPARATSARVPRGTASGIALWQDDPLVVVPETGTVQIGFRTASLPGGPMDEGSRLFHEVQPSGAACASCHPGGTEDGHTWVFGGDKGPRRTQALAAGLTAAPFHRDGEHQEFSVLWTDTFVTRMGGNERPPSQVNAVLDYLIDLGGLPWTEAPDAAAAVRGEQAYADAGCAGCHGADARGGDRLDDVGTGAPFLAPSLEGIAARAPYFHDGCAEDLQATVDGSCASSPAHRVSGAELADVVSFLATR